MLQLALRRVVLRCVKLDYDVALRFDWSVIDQRRLVAPFADGFDSRGNKVGGTQDWPEISDTAVLRYRG